MLFISRDFAVAVKLSDKKNYQIAHEAGLHPATLSKLVCGIEKVRPEDPRVLAVARVLGLRPENCFEDQDQ